MVTDFYGRLGDDGHGKEKQHTWTGVWMHCEIDNLSLSAVGLSPVQLRHLQSLVPIDYKGYKACVVTKHETDRRLVLFMLPDFIFLDDAGRE